jgi:hypothetical protein
MEEYSKSQLKKLRRRQAAQNMSDELSQSGHPYETYEALTANLKTPP